MDRLARLEASMKGSRRFYRRGAFDPSMSFAYAVGEATCDLAGGAAHGRPRR